MVTRWIFSIFLVASGPLAAENVAENAEGRLPVHIGLGCADATLALTLQGESGRLFFSGAEMPMARARSASGVKFDSIDDPETHVWTKGDEAMVRIAGQDLEGCRVARVSRVTEGPWHLVRLDGAQIEETPAELTFEADGSFSGRAGCETLTGSWAAPEAGALTLAVDTSRADSCPAEDAARGEALLAAMQDLTSIGFSAEGELELRAGDVTRLTATH